jgi:hypothetical protein
VTWVLTQTLGPDPVNYEHSLNTLLQLLTQLHPIFDALQDLLTWIYEQLTEVAHPYPLVTQVGWYDLQSSSVSCEFGASAQTLGIHGPEARILPVAVVLQGPSVAVNLPH